MLLGLIAALTIETTYPRLMEIVEIDRKADVAICLDATGNEWEFSEPEDLFVGDLVICTMNNKGTVRIYDDEIVDVLWSGYTVDDFSKPLERRQNGYSEAERGNKPHTLGSGQCTWCN